MRSPMVFLRRPHPVVVTTLPSSDHQRRVRSYVTLMSLRTVCLLAAVLVPSGPWTPLLLVAAVVLPMFAVIGANNPRSSPPPVLLPTQRRGELERSRPVQQ